MLTDELAPSPQLDAQDTAAIAGLFGSSADLDVVVDRIKRRETDALDKERDSFETDRRDIEARLFAASNALAKSEIDEAEARTAVAASKAELEPAQKAVGVLSAARSANASALASRRATYGSRFLQEKTRAYAQVRNEASARWIESQKQLLALQKAAHEIETERRKLNEKEFARRSDYLQEQQVACRSRLQALEAVIERLRLHGITRTVSGFLLWAGYLSFGAAGWLLGEMLSNARTTPSAAAIIFSGLGRAITALASSVGPWIAMILIVIGPPAILALIFSIIWIWDYFLAKFDRAWLASAKRARKDRPGLWLQDGLLVTRAHYTDVLAKLPMVYLWGLVPVALAAFPALAGISTQSQRDPWESVIYTYAGTVVVLAATGLSLLYVVSVVRPRHTSLIEKGSVSRLSANWELLTIAAFGMLVCVGLPLARVWFPTISDPWSSSSPYGLGVVVVTVAFATSHGLIFHGLFRDLGTLRIELASYDIELQKYSALPSVEIYDAESERFRETLASLYQDIDDLWKVPDWWVVFGVQRVSQRWWRRWRNSDKPLPIQPPMILTRWDMLLEPELAGQLQKSDLDLELAEKDLSAKQTTLAAAAERLNQVKNERQASARLQDELARSLRDRTGRHHDELDKLSRQYSDFILQIRTAFRVGESLRPTS